MSSYFVDISTFFIVNTLSRHAKSQLQYTREKNLTNDRSSLPKVLCKKGALRNFSKFTGKHLGQSVFLNKVAGGLLLQNTSGGYFCNNWYLYTCFSFAFVKEISITAVMLSIVLCCYNSCIHLWIQKPVAISFYVIFVN